MVSNLKAELYKLATVRSTYILTGIAMALVAVFAFYIQGFKMDAGSLNNPNLLAQSVFTALVAVIVFAALVAILPMTHEYRYNTISYTLTASRSRSKVLAAKIMAVSIFGLVFTVVVAVLSPVLTSAGVHAAGHTLVPQTLDYGDLVWRSLLYGWGYTMLGLLLATLIRNQVGAIAAIFLIPGAVEQVIGLLLKSNAVYQPFTALDQIVNTGHIGDGHLEPGAAALVFACYLVVGWIIAWVVFLKRDAS